MAVQIQLRTDTASNWTTSNPTLAQGEIGIELGSPDKFKIGDGSTSWTGLPYAADGTVTSIGVTSTDGSIIVTGSPITTNGTINLEAVPSGSSVFVGDLKCGLVTSTPTSTIKLGQVSGPAVSIINLGAVV